MHDSRRTNPLRVGYLAGSNHTGSTLLALLMDTHPQIASVGETSTSRGHAPGRGHCSCGEWIRDCAFWTSIFDAVTRQGVAFNAHNWSNNYRYRNFVLHRLLSRFSRNRHIRLVQMAASRVLPGHRARIERVNRANVLFIRSVLDSRGAEVLFDTSKNAARLYHLLQVPEIEVRVIRLVRDVRGFASSEKKRGRGAVYSANVWMRHQEAIADVIRGLPPERVLLVRYEDVCSDPRQWLGALQTFLGVKPVELALTVSPRRHHVLGNPIRKSEVVTLRAPDDWHAQLSPVELSTVLRIAGAANARLGYV